MTPVELRARALKNAQTIITRAKSAERDLSVSERATVEKHFSEVEEQDAIIENCKEGDAIIAKLAGQGGGEGPEVKGRGGIWAKAVARRLSESASGSGVKALLTGEVNTPPVVDVAALPETPTRLLDLVPRQELEQQVFAYLRQTLATNNAAPVADGDTKPTSVFTFEEVEDRARVIAHLSEAFPIRYAQDNDSLIQVLNSQMAAGVFEAIEDLIVNGAGTGEEWSGILNVAETTSVAFAADVVTTLRKARTALEVKGEAVTGVAMNPNDVEALDLLREDGTAGGFLLDGSAYERIFGAGVAGVPSNAVPEGTAIVGDFGQTRLLVRENANTLAATQGDGLFEKNQMKLRTEGRYGFQVLRPQAIVVVELTAA